MNRFSVVKIILGANRNGCSLRLLHTVKIVVDDVNVSGPHLGHQCLAHETKEANTNTLIPD